MPNLHRNRRQFLRATGIALALPVLESLAPFRSSAQVARAAVPSPPAHPKRMIAICNNLGVLPGKFFPADGKAVQSGTLLQKNYTLSPYLQELKKHRNDFTVFSGVGHPGVDGSHASDVSFLTAAPHPASGGFRNSISLDQVVARELGNQTRFPSLTLGVNAKQDRRSLSWTSGGVLIPCENSAAAVYRQLFLQGSKQEIDAQIRKLRLGRSIMDTLGEQARDLERQLGVADRDRMEQFATAVRDVEQRMVQSEQWELKPKPSTTTPLPPDVNGRERYMEKTRLMYQMARLAVETDSTRAITILLDSNNSPTIDVEGAEISDGYHNLSHHGKSKKKLQQLEAIDRAHMRLLGELFQELKSVQSGEQTLLDQTMVLYGSNFGDANKHTTDNMPVLLAGGGFRHGQHLAFDRDNNYPLPNLYVSMLQQFGIETDSFASATGTMRGMTPT